MKKDIKVLPKFENEDKERDFWDSHDLSEYFDMSKPIKMVFSNLKPTSELISLRLPGYLLSEIKKQAHKRDMPYQSLMKARLYDLFMGKEVKKGMAK